MKEKTNKKKRNLEREVDFLKEWLLLIADFVVRLTTQTTVIAGTNWQEPFQLRTIAIEKKYGDLLKGLRK